MNKNLIFKITAIFLGIAVSLVAIEIFLRVQSFIELDGFAEKKPWNPVLHHGDDSFVVQDFGQDCSGDKSRILLLGDSWMEDAVLSGTIGRELASRTGECIQAVNGGHSSYAPTLYLLKARQAFERYGKFDAIVVNIDETDIGDEWLRYRVPLTRDRSGKILAVPFKNDLRSVYVWHGKLWAEDSSLYLTRFLKFAFFYNVLVPFLDRFTVPPNHYETLMTYVFSSDPKNSHAAEKSYFHERLLELVESLVPMTARPGAVYLTHHPHFRGLVTEVEKGPTYRPVVSNMLAEIREETGAEVLDARNHVAEIHGEKFLLDTFEENDPYSHLASEGAIRYGKWIAEQISQEKFE